MRQNYRLFGVWRLLAAMLVMAYHFSHYAPNPEPIVEWFEHMLPLLDMFFIMSGFLIFEHYGRMENTSENYVLFLIKRLSRLYPLHLITLMFFVAFGVLVHLGLLHSQGADTRYDFSALPANLLLIQAWGVDSELTFNYVSWSLSGEWFAYLIFPIVLFASARGRAMGLALLVAVIIVALEIADNGATEQYDFWFDTKLWAAYRVAADFSFGAFLCEVTRQLKVPPRCQWLAWSMLGGVFAAMFSNANIYLTLAMFGVAIVLAALADRTEKDETAWLEPIMPVAAVSFGVYLWHPVIELFAYSLFWKRIVGVDDPVLFWIYMPLPVMLTVCVAVASARRFERPVGKWIETTLTRLARRRILSRQQA
ncbi:acyltransferase [Hoeflea sp. AS60]|uniref:acyltransferase family protein n=1 Tax=Hoeflea sp. AS60 TaxID=3135780 RepID=UPI00316C532B